MKIFKIAKKIIKITIILSLLILIGKNIYTNYNQPASSAVNIIEPSEYNSSKFGNIGIGSMSVPVGNMSFGSKGRYYITATAKGYHDYESKEFKAEEGSQINFNIEMQKKFD